MRIYSHICLSVVVPNGAISGLNESLMNSGFERVIANHSIASLV